MVSNLMNFIGSSLSFMLPPLMVEEFPATLDVAKSQISNLLLLQLGLAGLAFVMTLVLYESSPPKRVPRAPRVPLSFLQELQTILRSRDFWIVNIQFSIYIMACDSFDAVEGVMLEHHGYNASLTAWTAGACCSTAILSTVVECLWISDPSFYRFALVTANLFMAAALFTTFCFLSFRWHELVFILAVSMMGLATPGWGCSCELACEVSYPARESTVTSVMQAFSSVCSVAGIVSAQWMIEASPAASFPCVLGFASVIAAVLPLGLSGRHGRKEAENIAATNTMIDRGTQTDKDKFRRISSF
eukprot:TRINITY_DN31457_c0_g2_i1.p1 TRINITY_DN31457_c0_g2~~TRINITY_DN31457_c0_g2_i1.p1  ORF type:complete len:313 (+),score=47.89 TRINITY_DN31457_c0_g2_i1:35-940(+)